MVDRTILPLGLTGSSAMDSNNSGGKKEAAVHVPEEQQLSVEALTQTPVAQHGGGVIGRVALLEQHEGGVGVCVSTGRIAANRPGSGVKWAVMNSKMLNFLGAGSKNCSWRSFPSAACFKVLFPTQVNLP